MAKRSTYTLSTKQGERIITATPVEAARAATREARGTFDRTKTWDEQSESAHSGLAVKLVDDRGAVVMSCAPGRPSVRAERAFRSARHGMASCDITPSFKRKLRTRRKARR